VKPLKAQRRLCGRNLHLLNLSVSKIDEQELLKRIEEIEK